MVLYGFKGNSNHIQKVGSIKTILSLVGKVLGQTFS